MSKELARSAGDFVASLDLSTWTPLRGAGTLMDNFLACLKVLDVVWSFEDDGAFADITLSCLRLDTREGF